MHFSIAKFLCLPTHPRRPLSGLKASLICAPFDQIQCTMDFFMRFLHKPHMRYRGVIHSCRPQDAVPLSTMPVQAAHCKYDFPFNSVIKSKKNIIQNSGSQVVTCCSLLNCPNTSGKSLRKNYNSNFIAQQTRGSHAGGRRH